jgi:hypothetical protein
VTLSVCVFCSSAGGLPDEYRQAAGDLGRELAVRGHRLVYGGGNVGLMGELARSVHANGGTVVGVIPQGLVDRELAYDLADELLVTGTLRDHNDTFSVKQPQRQSGCVEITLTDDRIVVRDAKDRAGPVLVFTPTERDAFLDGIRDGEFDPASARRRRSPPGPRRCAAPREPPPRRSPRTVLATYPRGRQDPTVLWPRLRGGSRCPIPHRSELRSLQRFGQPKPSVPTDRARF